MKFITRYFFLLCLFIHALAHSQYKVTSASVLSTNITLSLSYTGKDEYYVKETSPILKKLTLVFQVHTFLDFYIKIVDADNPRFEIPQGDPFPLDPFGNFSYPINLSSVRFDYTEDPFDFRISRRLTNTTIFSTYDLNFVYSDKYLEIGTQLETKYTWGLGERFTNMFRLGEGKWTIFNRDRGEKIDTGKGLQTYGYYPFYLQK